MGDWHERAGRSPDEPSIRRTQQLLRARRGPARRRRSVVRSEAMTAASAGVRSIGSGRAIGLAPRGERRRKSARRAPAATRRAGHSVSMPAASTADSTVSPAKPSMRRPLSGNGAACCGRARCRRSGARRRRRDGCGWAHGRSPDVGESGARRVGWIARGKPDGFIARGCAGQQSSQSGGEEGRRIAKTGDDESTVDPADQWRAIGAGEAAISRRGEPLHWKRAGNCRGEAGVDVLLAAHQREQHIAGAAVQRDAPVGKQLDRRGQWAGDGEQRGGHRHTAQCGGPLVLGPKAQDRRVLGKNGVCRIGRTVVARRNAGALQPLRHIAAKCARIEQGDAAERPAIRQTSHLMAETMRQMRDMLAECRWRWRPCRRRTADRRVSPSPLTEIVQRERGFLASPARSIRQSASRAGIDSGKARSSERGRRCDDGAMPIRTTRLPWSRASRPASSAESGAGADGWRSRKSGMRADCGNRRLNCGGPPLHILPECLYRCRGCPAS